MLTFVVWLSTLDNLNAEFSIVESYLQEGNYGAAQAWLNGIPAWHDLTKGVRQETYTRFKALKELGSFSLPKWSYIINLGNYGGFYLAELRGCLTITINKPFFIKRNSRPSYQSLK